MSAAWVAFGACVIGAPAGLAIGGWLALARIRTAELERDVYLRALMAHMEDEAARTLTPIAKPKPAGTEWMDEIAEAVEVARMAEWGGKR